VAQRARQIGCTLRACLTFLLSPLGVDAAHVVRWGIGLFMYQTLDAIDGWVGRIGLVRDTDWADVNVSDRKQARRTGMQGPLGEMFDHGMYWPFPTRTPLNSLWPRMRCS